jgi:cytoskeletal protein CcmA (bactofilin family)
MKQSTLSLLLGMLLLMFGHLAHASQFKSGDNLSINQAIEGNLYAAGGKVLIEATINGDLLTAAGEINIRDSIGEDAFLAAGNVLIDAAIKGDARVMCGAFKLYQNIGGDLIITSGDIEIAESTIIAGDLIIAGGTVNVKGLVKGNIKIYGGDVNFSGTAEKEVILHSGTLDFAGTVQGQSYLVANKFQLGDNAKFFNDVEYFTPQGELDFSSYLQNGAEASYNPDLQHEEDFSTWQKEMKDAFWAILFFRFLAGVLLIVLLILLFNNIFDKAINSLPHNHFNNIGIGALFILAMPVVIGFAAITIIGIPVSIILGLLYGLALALSHVLIAILAAHELQNRWEKEWSKGQLILVAVGVFFLLKILSSIPLLGWLIAIVATLMAFGTIIQYYRDKKKHSTVESDIL